MTDCVVLNIRISKLIRKSSHYDQMPFFLQVMSEMDNSVFGFTSSGPHAKKNSLIFMIFFPSGFQIRPEKCISEQHRTH